MHTFTLPLPIKTAGIAGLWPEFTEQWSVVVKEIGSGAITQVVLFDCLF